MPVALDWRDLALRLVLSLIASGLIGIDRTQHGRAAGLRTTILVGLAATVAMIQTNILMVTNGRTPDSFVMMDVMRLPLGVLTGVGFIGGGAILRHDGLIVGVTTAASLWFVTAIGLCFGGDQIALGLAGLALGLVVVTGLQGLEARFKREQYAVLAMTTDEGAPPLECIRAMASTSGYRIIACSAGYLHQTHVRTLELRLQWQARPGQADVPAFVEQLSHEPAVHSVRWKVS